MPFRSPSWGDTSRTDVCRLNHDTRLHAVSSGREGSHPSNDTTHDIVGTHLPTSLGNLDNRGFGLNFPLSWACSTSSSTPESGPILTSSRRRRHSEASDG